MNFLLEPPASRLHQASDNKFGYTTPPLDGSLSIPELYDFHYTHNPEYPVFTFSEGSDVTFVRFREVVPAAYAAARFIGKEIGIDVDAGERLETAVAILAATDTITYFATLLGMFRADIKLIVISPRNSPAAIAHLITKTSASHLLVSAEAGIQDLAKTSLRDVVDITPPTICTMPTYKDIYGFGGPHIPLPPRRKDPSATRLIVHSSGSTSFPKPVDWNDRSYLQVSTVPLFGDHDLLGAVFGCYGIAMFHGIGLNFIAWLASTGLIMATFPPAAPAIVPTPDTIWNAALIAKPSYLFGPPVFFEGWSKDTSKLPFLKQLKGLVFGGAPLEKKAGDFLASEGCAIYSLYGSTEVGPYCKILGENPGMDWEYLELNRQCALEFEPLGDGTFEMIAVARPTTELTTINSTRGGEPAYATNDFLEPHPTLPNRWKVLGRLDDQIMLSTGEKTNPGPLEAILCQHPHVRSALMFGRGRFQNGVLIEIKKEHAFDPRDVEKLEAFRDLIWPQVEQMNEFAPAHSRLFRDMIIVASPEKPFQYTPKGPPRRRPVIDSYAPEIEALYANSEKGAQIDIPAEWNPETSLEFTRTVVCGILKGEIADHDDMFDRGCDSLQASRIRQSIQRSLGLEASSTLSPNFVYDHPSISSLASAILSTENNSISSDNTSLSVDPVERLRTFLDPYIADFPAHKPKRGHKKRNSIQRLSSSLNKINPLRLFGGSRKDVVLITGTTGALGAATLAELDASSDVQKIYALNRPSKGKSLAERQEFALQSRGYDPKIIKSSKVVLLEGDLTRDGLVIDEALREEIRQSVTHIIHIAWRVDFNLTLSSFKAAVDGVRGLVDLALSSPRKDLPKFVFASSVGIFRNEKQDTPFREERLTDPSICLGQGYAEAKWISEEILYEAAKKTTLRPTVVRIGQICGGTNGAWNSSDWLPALVKSSITMGFLPELAGDCSWIPLDLAAVTMAELRSAEASGLTAHLVHPRPVRCQEIIKFFGDELKLPIRPYQEWVESLSNYASDATSPPDLRDISESVPAIKTLSFFRGALSKNFESRDAMGIPTLEVTQTLAASRAFKTSHRNLNRKEVHAWLEYWRSVQFL